MRRGVRLHIGLIHIVVAVVCVIRLISHHHDRVRACSLVVGQWRRSCLLGIRLECHRIASGHTDPLVRVRDCHTRIIIRVEFRHGRLAGVFVGQTTLVGGRFEVHTVTVVIVVGVVVVVIFSGFGSQTVSALRRLAAEFHVELDIAWIVHGLGRLDFFGEAAPHEAIAALAPLDGRVDSCLQKQVEADAFSVEPAYDVVELGEG